MILKPFFSYYGGKYRISHLYPEPRYDSVIEPFAGAAGYSTRYSEKKVRLFDLNPVIVDLWNYLITVEASEVRKLPVGKIEDISALDIPQPAKYLLGFWYAKARSSPCNKPCGWVNKEKRLSRFYWGKAARERVARQVEHIRHWTCELKSWEQIADYEATWFVDPPYSNSAGRAYPFNKIDYPLLGQWCLHRKGQVIACDGGTRPEFDWLPFKLLTTINKSASPKGGKAVFKKEFIYHRSDAKVGFGLY
jgi:hypothetical protein